MSFFLYSVLNASIGLSLLAFLAGDQPKTIPTLAEKPTPNAIANKDIEKAVPIAMQIIYDKKNPITTPIAPPIADRNIDSTINCS